LYTIESLTGGSQMNKADIRNYAVALNTSMSNGSHLFISDIAKACGTNAVGVRSALDEDLNGFDYFQADRWSGSSFSGRYMQSWAVEPSKALLLRILITQSVEA
jgi:hypothetical protein